MHSLAPVALATILAATAPAILRAQAPAPAPTPFTVPKPTGRFTDPANLAGERPTPRNGPSGIPALPIDGGLGPDGKPDNALGLAQVLRKLNTRASLMLIVAHPDDEDGGMLAYYSRGLGARVAVLTLTRGEGGQNQATGDFEDALGLLRTQELLSADRYMGVDTQMFGTEVDFGFTKTKAEAFQKWNHERVLYDAVRAVRIFRPLVIAAVFSGAVTDGHGQHQVSGQIAQEVFKAAGDPNVFPELTREGILPWQPLKVFARVPFSRVTAQGLYDYATGQTVPAEFTNYVTGQTFTTAPTADVTINEGATDPLLSTCAANSADLPRSFSSLSSRSAAEGSASPTHSASDCQPLSYVQFARIGLGLQRSQIGAGMRLPRPGRSDVGYHLYGSRVCAPGLPNPTPNLCTTTSSTTNTSADTPGAPSSASEGSQGGVSRVVAREKTPSASPMLVAFTSDTKAPTETPSKAPADTGSKAPTARPMPAQGEALGTGPKEHPSAESAPYNPALANQPSFFDAIDTSLDGIATLAPHLPMAFRAGLHDLSASISRASSVSEATRSPRSEQNALSIQLQASSLADALKLADGLISGMQTVSLPAEEEQNVLHELHIKRAQLNDALALALGLSMQANADADDLPAQRNASATALLTEDSPLQVNYVRGWTENSARNRIGDGSSGDGAPVWSVSSHHPLTRECGLPGADAQITRPYFTRSSIEQPVYDLLTPELRNAPATPAALSCWAEVNYQGTPVQIGAVAEHDRQPVTFIPAASISLPTHAQVLPLNQRSLLVTLMVRPVGVRVEADLPPGWKVTPDIEPKHSPPGFKQLRLEPSGPLSGPVSITAIAMPKGAPEVTEGFRPIGYGTLPRTNFYTPATLRVVPVDLKLPPPGKRRIAYLPGTGDDVPAALASIGLTPTILKVSDLTPANLANFDTVVLGVRTYNAHPGLHGAPTQALLDFARNGGDVVVQTQTPEFTAADAPYPLVDHNERVIDETAPVQIPQLPDPAAQSPLLNTPNKITPADFNNWIEERGHGFLDSWDPRYTALTETHDPGAPAEHIEPQAPQRGGLITVQLGRGRWTYCAFALYRQLPEAVPGAFRLFVNLLNP